MYIAKPWPAIVRIAHVKLEQSFREAYGSPYMWGPNPDLLYTLIKGAGLELDPGCMDNLLRFLITSLWVSRSSLLNSIIEFRLRSCFSPPYEINRQIALGLYGRTVSPKIKDNNAISMGKCVDGLQRVALIAVTWNVHLLDFPLRDVPLWLRLLLFTAYTPRNFRFSICVRISSSIFAVFWSVIYWDQSHRYLF